MNDMDVVKYFCAATDQVEKKTFMNLFFFLSLNLNKMQSMHQVAWIVPCLLIYAFKKRKGSYQRG